MLATLRVALLLASGVLLFFAEWFAAISLGGIDHGALAVVSGLGAVILALGSLLLLVLAHRCGARSDRLRARGYVFTLPSAVLLVSAGTMWLMLHDPTVARVFAGIPRPSIAPWRLALGAAAPALGLGYGLVLLRRDASLDEAAEHVTA